MKYIEDSNPIWAIIKNAYLHNDQPIIFAIFNIIVLTSIGMTIYGIIKWKTDGTDYRFLTIFSGVVSLLLIGFISFYLFVQDNQVGKYEGTADVAFTSTVNGTDNKVARLADKDSSSYNTIVMDSKEMDKAGIKAGRTIEVETQNKPKPNEDRDFVYLEKDDIKKVSENKKLNDYNDKQQAKEDKEKQEAKDKAEKEKKEKEKKDKEKKKK